MKNTALASSIVRTTEGFTLYCNDKNATNISNKLQFLEQNQASGTGESPFELLPQITSSKTGMDTSYLKLTCKNQNDTLNLLHQIGIINEEMARSINPDFTTDIKPPHIYQRK